MWVWEYIPIKVDFIFVDILLSISSAPRNCDGSSDSHAYIIKMKLRSAHDIYVYPRK